jgi:hypothetical protein
MDSEKRIKDLETANKILAAENQQLKNEIRSLKFQLGINPADLFINPKPVDFHATSAGHGIDYAIDLMDILAVESAGRSKKLYLRKAIRPVDGGKEQTIILTDNPKLNFENLLHSIQKNGHHILRVNRSVAINIYHYNFAKDNTFILIPKPPKGFKEDLIKIKTDSKFDQDLYTTRLMEIDRLSKHHKDFAVNLKKIEEISRYRK